MKKKMKELFKSRKFAAGFTAIALAAIIGGTAMVQQSNDIPELPVYTDPVMETVIEDEETPLASAPTVTTKTSKKSATKKVTLKAAATKTYTKTLPTTKKTSTKTQTSSTKTVVTQTTVAKATKEKYTKKSKVKVVNTTTTTTIKTTTTVKAAATNTNVSNTSGQTASKYTVDVAKLAPLMDGRILNAYKTLGFTVTIDSSVSYSGYFNASTRSIILQAEDETIYHELGHFIAFVSGNTDKSSSFAAVYNQEKASYTGYNKAYVTQNSSEYFAESVKDYILNRASLQSSRPQTYAAVNAAFAKITDAQVVKIKTVFASVWS